MQAYTLNALAQAYQYSGQPGRAAPLFRLRNRSIRRGRRMITYSIGLCNLSSALRLAGGLREADAAARRALVITREQGDRFQEAVSLYWLGLALAARGVARASESLRRSLHIFAVSRHKRMV